MKALLNNWVPAIAGAVLSTSVTVAVLRTDMQWVKKTLDRHETLIAELFKR